MCQEICSLINISSVHSVAHSDFGSFQKDRQRVELYIGSKPSSIDFYTNTSNSQRCYPTVPKNIADLMPNYQQ